MILDRELICVRRIFIMCFSFHNFRSFSLHGCFSFKITYGEGANSVPCRQAIQEQQLPKYFGDFPNSSSVSRR